MADYRRVPLRMHFRGGGEERSVLGHGVIDARADGHHRVHGRHQRQRHQRAENAGDLRAEQARGGERSHRQLSLQVFERRGVDEHEVQSDVERRHQNGSHRQRQRQRSRGLLQLFGDIGGRVPAAIGHIDEEQTDHKLRGDGTGGGARGVHRKVLPVAVANSKGQDDEGHQDQHLRSGEHVLQTGHALHSENIDGGEQQHQQARHHLRPTESHFHSPEPNSTREFSRCSAGKNCAR